MNYTAINLSNIPYKNKKYFTSILELLKVNPSQNKISAEVVVPLFKVSKLEFTIWKEIWRLACTDSESITIIEFI